MGLPQDFWLDIFLFSPLFDLDLLDMNTSCDRAGMTFFFSFFLCVFYTLLRRPLIFSTCVQGNGLLMSGT